MACINTHDFQSWSLTTGEVLGLPRVEIPPEVDVRMSEKVPWSLPPLFLILSIISSLRGVIESVWSIGMEGGNSFDGVFLWGWKAVGKV